MLQLATITRTSGLFLNFKCPYHAKVMKTFEQVSKTTGSQRDSIKVFISSDSENLHCFQHRPDARHLVRAEQIRLAERRQHRKIRLAAAHFVAEVFKCMR